MHDTEDVLTLREMADRFRIQDLLCAFRPMLPVIPAECCH